MNKYFTGNQDAWLMYMPLLVMCSQVKKFLKTEPCYSHTHFMETLKETK